MTYPSQSPLLCLPSELLQEIFQHLDNIHLAEVLSLRQCCDQLREESEPVLFKRIKFRGLSFERHILKRLLAKEYSLAGRVKTVDLACSLQVGMLDALKCMTGLRAVVWSVNDNVPPALLDFLQLRPQIQLHLIPRWPRLETVRLDAAALSSPSLHTLDTTVYAYFDRASTPSEFSVLRECLLKARGLKHLTLRLKQGNAVDVYRPGEVNLQLRPGDAFPALESLTLDSGYYHAYDLNAQHCQMWLRCMDWSRLRSLDVAHATSNHLLPALTGHVRGLVKLRLGFWPDYKFGSPIQPWACLVELDAVRDFIDSIDALREVELYTGEMVDGSQLEPSLLQNHGRSLRKLVVKLGMRRGWNSSHFEELRRNAPLLEDLEAPAQMEQEKGRDGVSKSSARGLASIMSGVRQRFSRPPTPRSVWPTRIHAILITFPRLQCLKLRVQLSHDSSQNIPDPRPESYRFFNNELARKTARRLYDESPIMKRFDVEFRSVEPCVVRWAFAVQRKWVPVEGIYRVVVDKSTIGELEELQRTTNRVFDPWGGIV